MARRDRYGGERLLAYGGSVPLTIPHLGDDTFGADFDLTVRIRFRVEGGKVVGASLTQHGETMALTRKP